MTGLIFKHYNVLENTKVKSFNSFNWCDSKKEFEYYKNQISQGGFIYTNELILKSSMNINVSSMSILKMINLFRYVSKELSFSYVYLVKGTHKGITRYKIGKANNVNDRIKRFEVKIPFDIDLEFSFLVKNSFEFESMLHRQYDKKRLSGEWFDLSEDDIKAIIQKGISKEIEDAQNGLEDLIQIERAKKRIKRYSNTAEYVKYLESLLVFNGIDFIGRYE